MNQLDDLLASEIFVSVASTVQRYKARCVRKMWWERCGCQVVSSTVHSDRWACSSGSSVSSISHNRHRSVTQATLFKSKLCKRKNSNTHTHKKKTQINKQNHPFKQNVSLYGWEWRLGGFYRKVEALTSVYANKSERAPRCLKHLGLGPFWEQAQCSFHKISLS